MGSKLGGRPTHYAHLQEWSAADGWTYTMYTEDCASQWDVRIPEYSSAWPQQLLLVADYSVDAA